MWWRDNGQESLNANRKRKIELWKSIIKVIFDKTSALLNQDIYHAEPKNKSPQESPSNSLHADVIPINSFVKKIEIKPRYIEQKDPPNNLSRSSSVLTPSHAKKSTRLQNSKQSNDYNSYRDRQYERIV